MDSATLKTGIIYCRVSSKEQVEGTSLETQEQLCRDYAARNQIEVIGIYLDKGESAKTSDRKQFIEAINRCAQRKPRVANFIVYKLDRFARNQADHVTIRALLQRYGTEVISVTEPIGDSPIGKALEGMLSVFAEFDNNVRTERSKAGMLARLQQGIWVWGAPIGYYRPAKKANLAPDPKTAPFIRMAFEEYAKGTHSFESLAQFLKERGFISRRGKKPICQLMEKILRNPIYYGAMEVWGKSFRGAFEPIISEDLFWKCQPGYRKKIAQVGTRVVCNPLFPLRKLVVCALCNRPLSGSTSKGRSGRGYPYYHHYNRQCTSRAYIPKHDLERRFVLYIDEITPSQRFIQFLTKKILASWEQHVWIKQETARELQKQISVLREERQQVFELHRLGRYSDEEFHEQKNFIGERIQGKSLLLEQQLEMDHFDPKEALEALRWATKDTARLWQDASYPLKVRFQKLLFPEKMAFDGDKIGTAKLSAIFQSKSDFEEKISNWGSLTGPLWNQIIPELKEWATLKRDFEQQPPNKKPAFEDMGAIEAIA